MKSAPAAFSRPAQVDPGQADADADAGAFRAAPSGTARALCIPGGLFVGIPGAAPAVESVVRREAQAEALLDISINAELAAIMDEKISKEKRRRKRGFLVTILFFVGVTGGAAGWVVSDPDRFEAMKSAIAEIKSVGDVQGMVAKYQKALDKVAVRGEQIDAATISMGVDPTSVDEYEDPGFDKEMQAMMGEDGGKTTAARDKLLREKFKSVQESGSLMPNKNEAKKEEKPDGES